MFVWTNAGILFFWIIASTRSEMLIKIFNYPVKKKVSDRNIFLIEIPLQKLWHFFHPRPPDNTRYWKPIREIKPNFCDSIVYVTYLFKERYTLVETHLQNRMI